MKILKQLLFSIALVCMISCQIDDGSDASCLRLPEGTVNSEKINITVSTDVNTIQSIILYDEDDSEIELVIDGNQGQPNYYFWYWQNFDLNYLSKIVVKTDAIEKTFQANKNLGNPYYILIIKGTSDNFTIDFEEWIGSFNDEGRSICNDDL